MGVEESDPISQLSLPPGFRFYPTDEELLVQYLCRKIAGHHFDLQIISDIDLYKFDPWDLPSKAIFGEKEWYFFSPRDRKYPNGSRPNRVAVSGYWKATGTDKIITSEGRKVGIKKSLVFYVGKAPKGTKTNWIMHEYKLIESPSKNGGSRLDDWVLCRIYKKNSSIGQKPSFSDAQSKEHSHGSTSSTSHQYDDVLESLPEIDNRFSSVPRIFRQEDQKLNLQNLGSGNFDWPTLAGLNSVPEFGQVQTGHTQGIMNSQNIMNGHNDMYAPAMQQQIGRAVDEEVQSGVRTQRVDNSGFFQQNVNGFSQSSTSTNSLDPFGIRFSTQPGGFGFRK